MGRLGKLADSDWVLVAAAVAAILLFGRQGAGGTSDPIFGAMSSNAIAYAPPKPPPATVRVPYLRHDERTIRAVL
jgi:hypothetical protein